MSDRIFRKTTTHISPYLGGLAPETHQFVEYLNREIVDYVSKEGLWIKGVVTREYEPPVRFIATANRIWAIGNLKLAAEFPTLGGCPTRSIRRETYRPARSPEG